MAIPTGPARQTPFFDSIAAVRENWGWFLGLGIFLILLGTLAVGAAVATTLVSMIFLGLILSAGGLAKIIYSFWAKDWTGFFFSLLTGILYLVIGALFLFKPAQSAAALTLLIGCLFVVTGLFKIIAPLFMKFQHWGWVLFSGIVSLALGIMVLAEWPVSALWLIGLFVGIDLLIYGWMSIFFALSAKNLKAP